MENYLSSMDLWPGVPFGKPKPYLILSTKIDHLPSEVGLCTRFFQNV